MTVSTIQFITKTRLAELSRQRESLVAQYDAAEAAGQGDDLTSVAKLYEGLKQVRISEFPLHRELANLKALFQCNEAPQSLIDFWREQISLELQRGRLRANLVYLFGACLSEWDEAEIHGATRQIERQDEETRMIADITAEPKAPPLEELSGLLSRFGDHHEYVEKQIDERLEKSLGLELGRCEGVYWISTNPHYPKQVRVEAKQFHENGALLSQLEESIRVANRDPRQWSWPEQGVKPRVLWTRNRWRLYPTLSLVELLCVNHVSHFWSGAIDTGYTDAAVILSHRSRLQKLIDLGAPEVIMANERRMLAMQKELASLDWYEPVDPWTEEPVLPQDEEASVMGIVGMRANRQVELRDSTVMGYGYGEGVNPMVKLVHAELDLLQAAFPNTPLHVLKVDVSDYFAAVPHVTLLTMLEGLGMTKEGIEFTSRYLQMPLKTESEKDPRQVVRGVPMELEYSHWLCETLMRLLEEFVHRKAKVRIVRQLDDLCLLSPNDQELVKAYEAINSFLADVGLTLNDAKSGAVTIGGAGNPKLPAENPRWGVLGLRDDGRWAVNQDALKVYLNDSRKEVEARHAVLAKVQAYNDQLKHLVWGLGMAMDLGDPHRQSVNDALLTFENAFFADGTSIFVGLQSLIKQRYPTQVEEIPLAWLYWPITAGGLGLKSAMVLCGQYQIAYDVRVKARKLKPSQKSDHWQNVSNEWADFYDDKNVTLEPANCDESRTMKSLVEGFIRRGKSVSGGQQEGLSPYWRWTLSLFGPEILNRLGTFEFLLTDLVPLQLIHDKLLSSDDMNFGED